MQLGCSLMRPHRTSSCPSWPTHDSASLPLFEIANGSLNQLRCIQLRPAQHRNGYAPGTRADVHLHGSVRRMVDPVSDAVGMQLGQTRRSLANGAMTFTDATATWRPVELRPRHMVLEAITEEPAALAPEAGAAQTPQLTVLLRRPPPKQAAKPPTAGNEHPMRRTPCWMR